MDKSIASNGFCDLETGVCGPLDGAASERSASKSGAVEIVYFTDPICSHCWATEPAWRRLLFHYGHAIRARHVYGGLLPSWNGFLDRGAGIATPADVAPHWQAVAERYGQPIDPRVWLEDPLPSSFPPSAAVHTTRLLNPGLEEAFLRRIRQAVFLEARNIARADVLRDCATDIGLDPERFSLLLETGAGEAGFESDRASVRAQSVRGFPTWDVSGPQERIRLRGTQVFQTLEAAVCAALGIAPSTAIPSPSAALASYATGTLREFAELLQVSEPEAAIALEGAGGIRLTQWLWTAPRRD